MYTTIPLFQPTRKRSIGIALVNRFGHTSYIYGSFLWPNAEGPRNLKGSAVSTDALWLGVLMAALMPVIANCPPKLQPGELLHGQEVSIACDENHEKRNR
jgi:hypothetical protein